jgi:osmoprotectant transport system permease protein
MIPLLGIGTYQAIAALFLYSLLPIVRNTHPRILSIPLPRP